MLSYFICIFQILWWKSRYTPEKIQVNIIGEKAKLRIYPLTTFGSITYKGEEK
jgi:hypothetical protein